jgi:hypothetical protein
MKSYQSFVQAQRARNPCLSNLCRFLSHPPFPERNHCRIECLDFWLGRDTKTALDPPERRNIDLDNLQDEVCPPNDQKERQLAGRVIIIEDLTSQVIELLGAELKIDPLFFAAHIHTPWKAQESFQTPDLATLPSRLSHETFVNLHYHRSLTFQRGSTPGRRLLRKANVDRKVVILPSIKDDQIGLAQHCVSILRIDQGSQWLGRPKIHSI